MVNFSAYTVHIIAYNATGCAALRTRARAVCTRDDWENDWNFAQSFVVHFYPYYNLYTLEGTYAFSNWFKANDEKISAVWRIKIKIRNNINKLHRTLLHYYIVSLYTYLLYLYIYIYIYIHAERDIIKYMYNKSLPQYVLATYIQSTQW